jgi:hypothetical protein
VPISPLECVQSRVGVVNQLVKIINRFQSSNSVPLRLVTDPSGALTIGIADVSFMLPCGMGRNLRFGDALIIDIYIDTDTSIARASTKSPVEAIEDGRWIVESRREIQLHFLMYDF